MVARHVAVDETFIAASNAAMATTSARSAAPENGMSSDRSAPHTSRLLHAVLVRHCTSHQRAASTPEGAHCTRMAEPCTVTVSVGADGSVASSHGVAGTTAGLA